MDFLSTWIYFQKKLFCIFWSTLHIHRVLFLSHWHYFTMEYLKLRCLLRLKETTISRVNSKLTFCLFFHYNVAKEKKQIIFISGLMHVSGCCGLEPVFYGNFTTCGCVSSKSWVMKSDPQASCAMNNILETALRKNSAHNLHADETICWYASMCTH